MMSEKTNQGEQIKQYEGVFPKSEDNLEMMLDKKYLSNKKDKKQKE